MNASGEIQSAGALAAVVAGAAFSAAFGVRQRYASGPTARRMAFLVGTLWWIGSALGLFTLLAFTLVMVVLFGDSLPPHGTPAEGQDGFRRALIAAALLALILTARDLLQVCRVVARSAGWRPGGGRRSGFRALEGAMVFGPELLGAVGRNSACLGAFAGPLVSGGAAALLAGRWIDGAEPAWALDVFVGFWLGPFTMEALARASRPRVAAAYSLIGGAGALTGVVGVLALSAGATAAPGGLISVLLAMAVPLGWSAALVSAGVVLCRVGRTKNRATFPAPVVP